MSGLREASCVMRSCVLRRVCPGVSLDRPRSTVRQTLRDHVRITKNVSLYYPRCDAILRKNASPRRVGIAVSAWCNRAGNSF